MQTVQPGVSCAGCPHRAAYVAVKEAFGRARGTLYCGNIGCKAAGPMHPAAATCPGGEEELPGRYKTHAPTLEEKSYDICLHFATDVDLMSASNVPTADELAHEGALALLIILASERASMAKERLDEIAARCLNLGAAEVIGLDPFDTLACAEALDDLKHAKGVHAIVFTAPCAQLMADRAPAPVEIDRYACVGCHRCAQITGCPALSFAPPAYRVDPDTCRGCDLCAAYCRTHVIYSPRARMSAEERADERRAAILRP